MKKLALTDSCYWLGLVDPTDQHHETSMEIAELINDCKIVFPWPCMYESVSTHLIRNRKKTLHFESLITKPGIEWLNDEKYRLKALKEVFELNRLKGFSYSLVDCIVREIIKDKNVPIDCLVTFNKKDFEDLCSDVGITIIND